MPETIAVIIVLILVSLILFIKTTRKNAYYKNWRTNLYVGQYCWYPDLTSRINYSPAVIVSYNEDTKLVTIDNFSYEFEIDIKLIYPKIPYL